jgi:hypothetical protein
VTASGRVGLHAADGAASIHLHNPLRVGRGQGLVSPDHTLKIWLMPILMTLRDSGRNGSGPLGKVPIRNVVVRRAVAANSVSNQPARKPDRVAAALAFGFIALLLATELVLTLPDENDTPLFVAQFYAQHRTFIISLQVLGLLDAALLAAYAWRLRFVDRFVGAAGLVLAACALAPTLITLVLAIVADPADTASAVRWNMLEPRADDILFIGIVLFAATVAVRLGRHTPGLSVLALLVAAASLARLILEAAGKSRGAFEAIGPLSFVVLIATMGVLSFRGTLRSSPPAAREPSRAAES